MLKMITELNLNNKNQIFHYSEKFSLKKLNQIYFLNILKIRLLYNIVINVFE